MADVPLFSDGQVAAIVGAVLTAGAAVAGAIKWAVSRLVTSNDAAIARLVKSVDDMASADQQLKEGLIELRAVVQEGREDIREIRAVIAPSPQDAPIRPSRPVRARTVTPVAGTKRAVTHRGED